MRGSCGIKNDLQVEHTGESASCFRSRVVTKTEKKRSGTLTVDAGINLVNGEAKTTKGSDPHCCDGSRPLKMRRS